MKAVKAIHGEKAFIGCQISSDRNSLWLNVLKVVNQLKEKGMDL